MGQYEAKQKLQQTTNSLLKIQKDVRTGKITANEVERIQGILDHYSNELVSLSKKVREADIYNVEQLINTTSKELIALKDESNLDQGAISTNSFRRSVSSSSMKEKSKTAKEILDGVEDIRRQIRVGEMVSQDYDRLQRSLVTYSQQLSSTKKTKKQEVEAGQKLISLVTEELLTKQARSSEDTAVKRSQVPTATKKLQRLSRQVSEESVSSKTPKTNSLTRKNDKNKQEVPKIYNRINTGSLNDIENKLEALKGEVKVAESNKDRNRLHFSAKSIQTLMTDLQMVNVNDDVLDEERKLLLEQNLIRTYQQIDKIKKQVTTENNISYLTKLRMKENREKHLQDLEEIEQSVSTIGKNLNHENLEAEKQTFNIHRSRLSSIEETSDEISKKKAQVANTVSKVEADFERLETEKRVHETEWLHYQNRIDLSSLTGTSESELYKKHHQYLNTLRDLLLKIPSVNQVVDQKQKYVLYNIENNIAALEKKVEENSSKLQEQVEEQLVLRKTSNELLVDNLVSSCNEFNQFFDYGDSTIALNDIRQKLTNIQVIIEQKLNALTTQSSASIVPKEDSVSVVDSSPSVSAQLGNIQKELLSLQRHIESSHYFKETPLYRDMKDKIEHHKAELTNLLNLDHDSRNVIENLLKYVHNVMDLLEKNTSSRRSTSDDLLVDIMSISSRVNHLGNKIQDFNNTIQDYATIKSNLLEHKHYLKNLQVPAARVNLVNSKNEMLQQIDQNLANLETLKRGDNNSTSEEEKKFNQELRKVKDKVARYSGTYKNVLYKSIENDLDKCLSNVDNVFKESNVALKVKSDIKNNKMILEQKSIKDRQYDSIKRDAHNVGRKELDEIKANIESVKLELSGSQQLSKDELNQLDAKLTLSILALDNFKHGGLNEEKDKLYREIHYYFSRIQELTVATDSTEENDQLAVNLLATTESELERIKPEILSFVGSETSKKFVELDEVLIRGTVQLSDLKIDQTSELYKVKGRLMAEMQKYSDILDERVQQTDELEKVEKEVKVMMIKLDSFNGYFGDSEYATLDEQIILLKVNLSKLHVNQELAARKTACMNEIDNCMRKLKDVARTEGTLV